MRFVALVLVLFTCCAGAARGATVRVTMLSPVEDVSLPFFCDWGYDWDERCYRDDSARLSLGGEPDKIWRSGLRFSLASIPAGAVVVTAELSLWYDGTCVSLRKTFRPCDGRAYEVEAHRILTAGWYSEREVEFDPLEYVADLPATARSQWLTVDVTDLVAEWQDGSLPNNGLLLKLADDEEAYDLPGPVFPSSTYGDASVRPRLTVGWSDG
jgi:TGF-beta propeptide